MKALLLSLILVGVAVAEPVPEYLKDGKIVVTLKNGKQYEYSTNEWMVVRRHGENLSIEGEQIIAKRRKDENSDLIPAGPNRVRALLGYGPRGLKSSTNGNVVKVEQNYGAIGGIGFDRQISSRFSIGGQAFTNQTYTLGVGYDF